MLDVYDALRSLLPGIASYRRSAFQIAALGPAWFNV